MCLSGPEATKHWKHHLDLLCSNSKLTEAHTLSLQFHFLCRSVSGKRMVLVTPTERSQRTWHCFCHCKFAFLCKYISRELDCACPYPAPCQRCILSSSAESIELLRWKQSFRPWTLGNSSKQAPPCFPDDTSDRTACPPDVYSYMWSWWIFYSQFFCTLHWRSWLKLADT